MKLIQRDEAILQIKVLPNTGYFFSGAQLILGACFLYIYLQPNSSKDIAIILAVCFLGLGLFTFLLSNTVTVTIDKSQNSITIKRKNQLRSRQQILDIVDIGQIMVESSGGPQRDRYWDVALRSKSGQLVYLAPTSTNSQRQQRIANLIDSFLGDRLSR